MSWSVWDILVVALAVLQIAVIVGIVMTILRIKSGPVDRVIAQGKTLADRGKALAASGKTVFENNRERAMALATEASGLAGTTRGITGSSLLANETITYAKLFGMLATVRKIRSGFGLFHELRRGGVKHIVSRALPKKSATPVRRSLPDRMGLVPPIVGKIAPVIRIARTAHGVHKQMKSRGLY